MEGSYEFINSTNSSSSQNEANVGYKNESPWSYRDDFDMSYSWMDEPIRDPLYVVIPITVIYATIFVTGIVGNVSTCIVIARNKSMHTATNYYLFSLAVSDLLLLILGMPVEIYQVWYKYPYIFGESFCIIRGLAAETSTNASVLTITAFTIERYVAICHPFLSQTMSKLSRAIKLILFIWVIALICAIPQAVQVGLVAPPNHPDIFVCSLKRVIYEDSFIVASVVFFVVPLLLISVLYLMIGFKLKSTTIVNKCKKHKRTLSTRVKVGSTRMDRHCRQHHSKNTKRVIKMLVAVVVTFFVCWAPFHIQRLIATTEKQQHQSQESNERMALVYVISTYVSGILYYFSTTINPILYSIMSNKYREAFMDTLGRSCKLSRFMRSYRRSYSSLSRSQQRNPAACPTKTTGMSLGAALAQESTDCSGNSIRDEFRQVDFSTSESPPSAICNGNGRESSRRDVISIEMGSCNMNLSTMSLSCAQPKNNGSSSRSPRDFVETFRQHQQQSADPFNSSMSKLSTLERDRNFVLKSSSTKQAHPCNVSYQVKQTENPKKKWWRLFDWLPGLKGIRASGAMTRPTQDVVVDLDRRQQQPQNQQHSKDYYLQLHTFKTKDESCRPV